MDLQNPFKSPDIVTSPSSGPAPVTINLSIACGERACEKEVESRGGVSETYFFRHPESASTHQIHTSRSEYRNRQ